MRSLGIQDTVKLFGVKVLIWQYNVYHSKRKKIEESNNLKTELTSIRTAWLLWKKKQQHQNQLIHFTVLLNLCSKEDHKFFFFFFNYFATQRNYKTRNKTQYFI